MLFKVSRALLILYVTGVQLPSFASEVPYISHASFHTENTAYRMSGDKQIFEIKIGHYSRGSIIQYLEKDKVTYDFPENAVVARFSALAAMDLAWWKNQWVTDAEARISLEKLLANGSTETELINRWGSITQYNNIQLNSRVTYENYSIVTYQVVKKGLTPEHGNFVLPVVFKLIDGAWKVSSGLSRSPLLAHSPWRTGNYNILEKDVWYVQEDN